MRKRKLIVSKEYITKDDKDVRIECCYGNVTIYLDGDCIYRQSVSDLFERIIDTSEEIIYRSKHRPGADFKISLLGSRVIIKLSEPDSNMSKMEIEIEYSHHGDKLLVDLDDVKQVVRKYIALSTEETI